MVLFQKVKIRFHSESSELCFLMPVGGKKGRYESALNPELSILSAVASIMSTRNSSIEVLTSTIPECGLVGKQGGDEALLGE